MSVNDQKARQRQRRRDARVLVPTGKMPPNWDELTNAQKSVFTQAQRMQMKNTEFYWAPDVAEHGQWSAYNNWFCRCPPCTQANTDNTYQYRQGQQ
jgi:hypothetical protein